MRTLLLLSITLLLSSCRPQYTTLIILQDKNGVPMDTLYFKGEQIVPPVEETSRENK